MKKFSRFIVHVRLKMYSHNIDVNLFKSKNIPMGDFCRLILGSTIGKTQVKTLKIYDRQQIKNFICNLNVSFLLILERAWRKCIMKWNHYKNVYHVTCYAMILKKRQIFYGYTNRLTSVNKTHLWFVYGNKCLCFKTFASDLWVLICDLI